MNDYTDEPSSLDLEKATAAMRRSMIAIEQELEEARRRHHKVQGRNISERAFLMSNPDITVHLKLGEQLYLALRDLADAEQMDVRDYALATLRKHAIVEPAAS